MIRRLYRQTPALECCGHFSPDGRWVSYDSWETGRREMYVQPFPGTTGRIRVSANGGGGSSWRLDGRELHYASNDISMVAVAVAPNGRSLTFGQPRVLFRQFGGGVAGRKAVSQRHSTRAGLADYGSAELEGSVATPSPWPYAAMPANSAFSSEHPFS